MTPKPLTWKRSLGLLGTLGTLATAAALTHISGPNCGLRILERWSLPYLSAVALLAASSAALLGAAALVSEKTARQIAQRLLAASLGLGLTLAALDATLRLTDPPSVLQPPFYENHPTLGYFYAPHTWRRISYPERGLSSLFITDENGFIMRGEPNTPQQDATRLMFLGDSFVAALQVAPQDSLSVKTVESLEAASSQPYQALNLGVNGYSPLQYTLAYEAFAPQFDPHIVVVVVFVGNDFTDTAQLVLNERVLYDAQGRATAIRPAIDYEKGLVWSDPFAGPVPIEEARRRVVSEKNWHHGLPAVTRALILTPLCQRLKFAQTGREAAGPPAPVTSEQQAAGHDRYARRNEEMIREARNAIYKDTYTQQDLADIELSLSALRRLANEVKADGRQLLLVVMPENHQVPGQGEAIKYRRGLQPGEVIDSTAPQALLADFCRSEGLDCLDLLPVFLAHSQEPIYLETDSHLAAEGHALVGQTIAAHLLSTP